MSIYKSLLILLISRAHRIRIETEYVLVAPLNNLQNFVYNHWLVICLGVVVFPASMSSVLSSSLAGYNAITWFLTRGCKWFRQLCRNYVGSAVSPEYSSLIRMQPPLKKKRDTFSCYTWYKYPGFELLKTTLVGTQAYVGAVGAECQDGKSIGHYG